MAGRWFTTDELEQMSEPTMDRAISALDRGDIDEARALCEEMRKEGAVLHDLMVETIAGLISYVQTELHDEGVEAAWRYAYERLWKHHYDAIMSLDRRKVVSLLARTWRAHSTSGVGPMPGAFSVAEDDEKFTFRMAPCGSGQRLVQRGAYEGELAYRTSEAAHSWTYGREDFPLYCTHCTFMNESLPLEWGNIPLYPSEPPRDYQNDPCVWYWYKRTEDIPAEYWERHGFEKPEGDTDRSPVE